MAGAVHTPEYRRFLVKLRQARLDADLSQAEAAAALGVGQKYVSKSELGERRVDVVEAERFAKIYGLELQDFSTGVAGRKKRR